MELIEAWLGKVTEYLIVDRLAVVCAQAQARGGGGGGEEVAADLKGDSL